MAEDEINVPIALSAFRDKISIHDDHIKDLVYKVFVYKVFDHISF